MATQLHEYPVTVRWAGGRDGQGDLSFQNSREQVAIAVPQEFQGRGGATNPEELLTGAISSCYTITFGIIAANRKLPVVGLNVACVGEVEQQGATFTYRKVTIRPKISLASDATDAHVSAAMEMAHKADGYCIVTNAVRGKVEVVVEPSVSKL